MADEPHSGECLFRNLCSTGVLQTAHGRQRSPLPDFHVQVRECALRVRRIPPFLRPRNLQIGSGDAIFNSSPNEAIGTSVFPCGGEL
jgi:hypothetical protein